MVLENAWIEVITFIRHAKANNCTCRSIKILFRASQEDSLLLYEDTFVCTQKQNHRRTLEDPGESPSHTGL